MKKIFCFYLFIILIIFITGCSKSEETESNIKDLQIAYITENTITIEIGQTVQDNLFLIVYNSELFIPDDIELISEDTSVVTLSYVDNNIIENETKENDSDEIFSYKFSITGVSSGETYIYAKEKDGEKETEKKKITVYDKNAVKPTATDTITIPPETESKIESETTTAKKIETITETTKQIIPITEETITAETVITIPPETTKSQIAEKITENIKETEIEIIDSSKPEVEKAVFWAPTGNKLHLAYDCSSFNEDGIYYCGTYEEACTVRTKGWCKICSKYQIDKEFTKNIIATTEAVQNALTYQDYIDEYGLE